MPRSSRMKDVMQVLAGRRRWSVTQGDCRELLDLLPENSVDSCVTDPPYEIGFMAKAWDKSGVAFDPETWSKVLRVLKPGAHLAAFGHPRTYHRLAVAVEDAGFEIRDCVMWLNGTGFPKSTDPGRDMDMASCRKRGRHYDKTLPAEAYRQRGDHLCPLSKHGDAQRGLGTALKPGYEPAILARKPCDGPVYKCVAEHGTGALQIDACRLGDVQRVNPPVPTHWTDRGFTQRQAESKVVVGRYPANVVLGPAAAALLDQQSGPTGGFAPVLGTEPSMAVSPGGIYNPRNRVAAPFYGDAGGASRFFYVAKPDVDERDFGCEDLPERDATSATGRQIGSAGLNSPRAGAGRGGERKNDHPTVKPWRVKAWLQRLLTPPGGVTLDPFLGSGTSGKAAVRGGFRCVGFELLEKHATLSRARIQAAERHHYEPETVPDSTALPGQLGLFGSSRKRPADRRRRRTVP